MDKQILDKIKIQSNKSKLKLKLFMLLTPGFGIFSIPIKRFRRIVNISKFNRNVYDSILQCYNIFWLKINHSLLI